VSAASFSTDRQVFNTEFFVFSPYQELVSRTCKGSLTFAAGVAACLYDNLTVDWTRAADRVEGNVAFWSEAREWKKIGLNDLVVNAGSRTKVKVVAWKRVGETVKWTFSFGGAVLDPLWSDPAGNAQGFYTFGNTSDNGSRPYYASKDLWTVQPYGSGYDNSGDGKWGNSTYTGGSCPSVEVAAGPWGCSAFGCDQRNGAEKCSSYVEKSGFSEGVYTVILSMYGESGDRRNVTIEAKPSSSDALKNFTVECNTGSGNYKCNVTSFKFNGLGIPVYVNSSGVLGFRIIGNENNDQEAGDLKIISGFNITNYTSSAPVGGPGTDQGYTNTTLQPHRFHGTIGAGSGTLLAWILDGSNAYLRGSISYSGGKYGLFAINGTFQDNNKEILFGTPSGTNATNNPKPRFKHGETTKMDITGI
jgi:hypothetical protein